ncbi:DoxX family protein [Sphingomonas aracearum]|uniref:DoxX family protein n=1 Tax=Sphingomonas aracearum TaxID=2283317 RepID=A0A369VTY6_9SPHN|nr:DoxX family protein [Sphingomonas aracearum]RDE05105.1 hypothetical protein DVW87_07415 [Sphingomonas aracearum]
MAFAVRETRGRRIARWLLMGFYAIAGIAHLLVAPAMVSIMPHWVPTPHLVVLVTGLCELAGVVGLATRRWRVAAAWGLAAYAVCVFPANVQHAIRDLGTGTGLPIWYHGPRLLLQPAIVWWALWAGGAWPRRRSV